MIEVGGIARFQAERTLKLRDSLRIAFLLEIDQTQQIRNDALVRPQGSRYRKQVAGLDIPFLLAEDVPAMKERVRIAWTVLGNLRQLVEGLIVALLILKGQAQIVPDLMVTRFCRRISRKA